MSASLVGSEMCIRDRSCSPEGLPGRGAGSPAPQGSLCEGPGRPSCAPPVSYTHLTLPTICSV
eukprot:6212513-Alexandrium_andersonii.AAC.1